MQKVRVTPSVALAASIGALIAVTIALSIMTYRGRAS